MTPQEWAFSTTARTFSSTPAPSQQAHEKVSTSAYSAQQALTTHAATPNPDVPVPTDFSIPYIDLELTTPDDVKIKAFLLLQRTILNMSETPVHSDGELPSDEEVRWVKHFLGVG